MTRVIVCDTGPLIHLNEAGAIHLLQQAGDIFVPPAVLTEFEMNPLGWKLPQWIRVHELDDAARQQAQGWTHKKLIDPGEAEAIGLALQVNEPGWFLTDDAQARKFAEALGLEAHGSIGLLLWSVAMGRVDEREKALALLDNIAHSSLWVSGLVLREARQAIDVLFSGD